jgi:hypothetical protein
VRISLLLLCLLVVIPVKAAWTGIAAFMIDGESNWQLGNNVLENDFTKFGLRIEEKTEVNLRIGASAGVFDLKFLDKAAVIPYEKYEGQFVSFYLRWPEQLSDSIRVHSLFNYEYNMGNQTDDLENEINWTEISLDLGISVQLGRFSIRPFADYRYVDGDITGPTSARLLELDKHYSSGLILDYFVEPTAFVRLRLSGGAYRSFLISLAREF